ncbi:polyadenylate-binding protein 1 [Scaptodrosophila lebanonensis]|uniref:Polyadenylate-binding protein 1 n=1 Tax=Drosophila lebanonensis TaxID=7225 RepID=A0A6J2UJT8_DROLE|nr:polyadenylate-binding protein 1 [Scaptodrosophila lebanonensis]
MAGNASDSGSDYDVELFIKPKRVRKTVNDDSADLFGNFDDEKRREILDGTYKNPSDSEGTADEGSEEEGSDEADNDNDASEDFEQGHPVKNEDITDEQLSSLLRGASKVNKYVLYVTNLNFETTKDDLMSHFEAVGTVKGIRIPKKSRSGFAFVEMDNLVSFKRGFTLHNTELNGRNIKVQISEAGKKKSANKKNIIKQKNRKLAEMRNEQKAFTKSGKFYDKDLKKEKAKDLLARQRWRKKPSANPNK